MHRAKIVVPLLIVALLIGIWSASAQEDSGVTYNVIAGMNSSDLEVAAFGPARLQVHRGDTVRWLLAGFHNIHIHTQPNVFLIPYEQDGLQTLQMNPEIAFPTIENGGTYTGGSVNSGLPLGGPEQSQPYFELTIDAEPGVYTYFCDIHAGMAGTIEVVADEVAIPSPSEALAAGFEELYHQAESGFPIVEQAKADANSFQDGGAQITLGTGSGIVANYDFYPNVVIIAPGQSVTWTMSNEVLPLPVGVSSVPVIAFEQLMNFVPPSEAGPPSIIFTEVGVNGSVPSGSEIGLGDSWYSGMLDPGESYTLTFTEPGVYLFVDSGPGKQGAVVVQP